MTKQTTLEQARELASNLEDATLMGSSRAADYLRSLAAQVEALTAERDDLLGKRANLEGSILSHRQEIGKLRAELDRLKKQEPHTYIDDKGDTIDKDDVAWFHEEHYTAIPLYLSAGAQPDTKEMDALRADADRYAAKRKEIFLTNMRMQVSGQRATEEEFNANYDANCDKAIKGYVADHRGVLAFNAKMVEPKPPAVICGNCDTALPGGCGGQFLGDGEHCRFGKDAS